MKRTKLMLGAMILGLGMAGAAWAQPAPNHDYRGNVYNSYRQDSDDAYRAHGDRDDRGVWRGNGDRDDSARNTRGDRDDRNVGRGDRDQRTTWNWGHTNIRRNGRDNR